VSKRSEKPGTKGTDKSGTKGTEKPGTIGTEKPGPEKVKTTKASQSINMKIKRIQTEVSSMFRII
jgi:hypothetical protein